MFNFLKIVFNQYIIRIIDSFSRYLGSYVLTAYWSLNDLINYIFETLVHHI